MTTDCLAHVKPSVWAAAQERTGVEQTGLENTGLEENRLFGICEAVGLGWSTRTTLFRANRFGKGRFGGEPTVWHMRSRRFGMEHKNEPV